MVVSTLDTFGSWLMARDGAEQLTILFPEEFFLRQSPSQISADDLATADNPAVAMGHSQSGKERLQPWKLT